MEIQLYGVVLVVVLALAVVGCALMTTAFAVVIWRRSWDAAMKPDERGQWPLARKLMATGAGLGTIVGLLILLLMEWGNRLFGQ
jgi:hypothetical protein